MNLVIWCRWIHLHGSDVREPISLHQVVHVYSCDMWIHEAQLILLSCFCRWRRYGWFDTEWTSNLLQRSMLLRLQGEQKTVIASRGWKLRGEKICKTTFRPFIGSSSSDLAISPGNETLASYHFSPPPPTPFTPACCYRNGLSHDTLWATNKNVIGLRPDFDRHFIERPGFDWSITELTDWDQNVNEIKIDCTVKF